jgi:dTDP-4-dehydrorhamnose 3,5-epimerase
VRCTRGAVFDVAVDLRPDSPPFRKWVGVELTAEDGRALYIPRGFAHGFYSLVDSSEVAYQISTEYRPDTARGVRWNDPLLGVAWPGPVEVIAPRDRTTRMSCSIGWRNSVASKRPSARGAYR